MMRPHAQEMLIYCSQRLPLTLASAVLAGCATTQPPLSEFSANSGSPRAPEQLAVTFEKVDLALRVDPATRSINGDAALTFLLNAPLTRIAVELDRNLPVDGASVDGVDLPPSAISNPDGRLYLTLPAPLPAGAPHHRAHPLSRHAARGQARAMGRRLHVEQNLRRPAVDLHHGRRRRLRYVLALHRPPDGQAQAGSTCISACRRRWWWPATASRSAWRKRTAGAPTTGARKSEHLRRRAQHRSVRDAVRRLREQVRQHDSLAHVVSEGP
jgi:hypothetical protein